MLLSHVHHNSLSVFVQRVIRAVFGMIILFSMLISGLVGVQPVQATAIRVAEGQGFTSHTSSPSISSGAIPLAPQQTTPCEVGEDLIVEEEECYLPAGTYDFGTVIIREGATLVLMSDTEVDMGVALNAYDLIVETGAVITADGQGFFWNDGESGGAGGGEGAPEYCDFYGSGGGHGGQGGAGGECDGGLPYGDLETPYTLGSSGGSGGIEGEISPGGNGGGAIEIWVEESITIDGLISANGMNGESSAGGGSGGSIAIGATDLNGNGSVQANGGDSEGGGGAGGRIGLDIGGGAIVGS